MFKKAFPEQKEPVTFDNIAGDKGRFKVTNTEADETPKPKLD